MFKEIKAENLMKQKVVAVIQARMGSSRLPEKSLKKIGNIPIIKLVLRRVSNSKEIDKVILATTDNEKDDILAKYVEDLGFTVFRGSENDVLSRFYHAIIPYSPSIIVRITGDCPLISPILIDQAIQKFIEVGVDYLSLSIGKNKEYAYPRGFDIEVTHFDAMKTAYEKADKNYEREHVMPFLYTNKDEFSVFYLEPEKKQSRPNYRLCVDTDLDLEMLRTVFGSFENKLFVLEYQEIIEVLDNNPQLASLNTKVNQKHFTTEDERHI